jgi:putative ABC transport system permease protein
MLKANLLPILRSFKKNKGYTAINIAGLAIGFASAILIAIYVNQELTYDKHFKDHERTYRMSHSSFALASVAQLSYLQQNMTGVEAWTNVMPNPSSTLKYNGQGFIEENTFYTTKDYLRVFDHKFVLGNPNTALDETNGLILTESMANKMFGNANPLGELVEVATQMSTDTYQVTGVVEDLPPNSTLKFNVMARLPQSFEDQVKDSFSFTTGYSYFKTETAIPVASVQTQTDEIFAKRNYELYGSQLDFETYLEEVRSYQPVIMNITDVHLESNVQFEASNPGNKRYLYIFLGIAIFILVLAAINYVNLATAQASKRAKEVGVRKVLGSVRGQLIGRFLTESVVLALSAVMLGLGLAEGTLQLLAASGFPNFDVSIIDYPNLIGITLGVAFVTGLGAGIYPALVLTSFKPASVLKGDYRAGEGSKFFRNSLVVFQFVVSLSLAIFSVFVYQQLNYGLTKELGFEKEGVIVVDNSKFQLGGEGENVNAFKNEVLKIPAVKNFSGSHYSMIGNLPLSSVIEIGGEEAAYRVQYKYTDAEFVPTMGFNIIEGRDFDEALDGDREAIIVNETFAKMIGDGLYEKHFNAGNNGAGVQVVGVVEDFHYADFSKAIGPTVFFKRDYASQFNIRLEGKVVGQTIKEIEARYAQFTNEPLDFYFFDQRFNTLFNGEKQMSQIITIFTGLSLFVALLGLIGLISYKLDQRIKEIGVRKVLGASVSQILRLFSIEMVKLISIALLITVPLGFYMTDLWLNGFAYQVEISIMPFVLVAAFGLAVTLLIVCLRSYNAATKNPVNSLRSE